MSGKRLSTLLKRDLAIDPLIEGEIGRAHV